MLKKVRLNKGSDKNEWRKKISKKSNKLGNGSIRKNTHKPL